MSYLVYIEATFFTDDCTGASLLGSQCIQGLRSLEHKKTKLLTSELGSSQNLHSGVELLFYYHEDIQDRFFQFIISKAEE